MEFAKLAAKQLFYALGSDIRSWKYIPQALWVAISTGSGLRMLWRTLTGLRYLQKKGLPPYEPGLPGDKIHFLRTGSSDAILLESQGHFALVDAAEDSEYPADMPWLAYDGWEDYVTDYVKRVAGGKLDFILGTHAHSDHIACFDTVILDPDITIGRAYLKPYDNDRMQSYERIYWDNAQRCGQMVAALEARGVPLIENISSKPFRLGNFKLTIFNGEYANTSGDENDSSLGLLMESSGRRAFLAGDLNNHSGNENRLRGEIGQVDLHKCAHHGYEGSSTLAFATGLRPHTVVFPNYAWKVYPTVAGRYIWAGNTKRLLATGSFGGVAAVFRDGEIKYYAIGEYAQPKKARPV